MLLNIHVSDRSEAAAAVKEISEILKKKYPGLDAGVGTILCDSLLNHLLLEGFRDIKVTSIQTRSLHEREFIRTDLLSLLLFAVAEYEHHCN